jgi:hypothetical protein
MQDDDTPPDLREGVCAGIVSAIQRDVELRGARTAWRLVSAGVLGVLGALGVTLLLSGHALGPHHPWYVGAVAAAWAGLLVVSLALVLLQVGTPSLPLARSASAALLGLGLAGICGAACPDRHFLAWWSATGIGRELTALGGTALSAVCFGLVTSLLLGGVAAFVALGGGTRPAIRPLLPAAMLFILLLPGISLQSVGSSFADFGSWLVGAAAGAYAGIAAGIRARSLLGGA